MSSNSKLLLGIWCHRWAAVFQQRQSLAGRSRWPALVQFSAGHQETLLSNLLILLLQALSPAHRASDRCMLGYPIQAIHWCLTLQANSTHSMHHVLVREPCSWIHITKHKNPLLVIHLLIAQVSS